MTKREAIRELGKLGVTDIEPHGRFLVWATPPGSPRGLFDPRDLVRELHEQINLEGRRKLDALRATRREELTKLAGNMTQIAAALMEDGPQDLETLRAAKGRLQVALDSLDWLIKEHELGPAGA